LKIGFYIGDPISRLVRAFRNGRPETIVEVVRIYWSDQPEALLDGRVDVAFVHLPMAEEGMCLLRLFSSPRLALLPATHRLASKSEIRIADIADEPVVSHVGASPAWEAWHNVDPRPDGRSARQGPPVANLEEKLQVVGTGQAISFVPASVAAAVHMPPDVVAVPLADAPATEVCLAWKAEREWEAILSLADAAKTVFAQEPSPSG
jgi:DNA-binding transcriptional LysR family regulator